MTSIWVIILPAVLFSLTVGFNQEERKKAWIAYGIFSVFYALRGEVGTDWQAYIYYYSNINDPTVVARSGFESGYVLLCRLFSALGLSYWVMLFCISIFITYLFYKATEAQTQNTGIALLIALFYFFYPSLEAVRQTIALAIFYYSLKHIDDKPIAYFLLNFVAVMFHRTAVIAFMFYFFRKYSWTKVTSVVVVLIFPLLKPLLNWILSFSPAVLAKFQWYTANTGGMSHLLSVKVLECVALAVLFHLLPDKKSSEKLTTDMLDMGMWIQVLLPIIMTDSYRFGYYTDLGIILACCQIYDRLEERKHRRYYLLLLIGYIVARFLRIIIANPQLFV